MVAAGADGDGIGAGRQGGERLRHVLALLIVTAI